MSANIKLNNEVLEGVESVELEDAVTSGEFVKFVLPSPEPTDAKTATFINEDDSLYAVHIVSSGASAVAPISPLKAGYSFAGWNATKGERTTQVSFPHTMTDDIEVYADFIENINLESATWAQVREISDSGAAAAMWSVGDTKSITIPAGTQIGDGLTFAEDTTLYAFILGFDHNISVEASGYSHSITFGTFKTADPESIDTTLYDSKGGITVSSGTYFSMNNTNSNAGGWKASRMRYNLLGSTDVENGDATPAATSNPAANTYMAALPSDLRAVMKPIVKWTDNVGGSSSDVGNVSALVDYLPLLAETEVFGTRGYGNAEEQKHQAQYQYYFSGGSKKKYNALSTSDVADWWLRSPRASNTTGFCLVSYGGNTNYNSADRSYGCSPIFEV